MASAAGSASAGSGGYGAASARLIAVGTSGMDQTQSHAAAKPINAKAARRRRHASATIPASSAAMASPKGNNRSPMILSSSNGMVEI